LQEKFKTRKAPKALRNAYKMFHTIDKFFRAKKAVALDRIGEHAVYHIKDKAHF
jgi:hypothetical protein